jgi:hypothetical protein
MLPALVLLPLFFRRWRRDRKARLAGGCRDRVSRVLPRARGKRYICFCEPGTVILLLRGDCPPGPFNRGAPGLFPAPPGQHRQPGSAV